MSEEVPGPKQRLFFALWPSDELRRSIEEATVGIARHSGGHVVPARNFHVTLAFLGDISREQLPAVLAAGAATAAPRFSFVLDQVQVWPRSNVLVLDAPRTPPALVTLVDHLLFNLLEKQIKLKREVYRPHVTLARSLSRPRPLQKVGPFEWPVNEFALLASSLGAEEAKYTVLERWPLS